MSQEIQSSPAPYPEKKHIAIVASEYNALYTDALVEHCTQELALLMPNAVVTVIRVPGAYEIPVVIKAMARGEHKSGKPDGIVALGVIVRGCTQHADLVGSAVTQALTDISLKTLIPIIHEVLLLDNEDQAEERCLGAQMNRGKEAAGSVVKMVRLFSEQFPNTNPDLSL